jgi:hypothetical protein
MLVVDHLELRDIDRGCASARIDLRSDPMESPLGERDAFTPTCSRERMFLVHALSPAPLLAVSGLCALKISPGGTLYDGADDESCTIAENPNGGERDEIPMLDYLDTSVYRSARRSAD